MFGVGQDELELHVGGVSNTLIDMGTGVGTVDVVGSNGPDQVVITNEQPAPKEIALGATIVATSGGKTTTNVIPNVNVIEVLGLGGNDTIDASDTASYSAVHTTVFDGGAGNDVIEGSPRSSDLIGRSGTNTLVAHGTYDRLYSESPSDTLDVDDSYKPEVIDTGSAPVGRKVVGDPWGYSLETQANDSVVHVRPQGPTDALVTSALARSGQQTVTGARLEEFTLRWWGASGVSAYALADVQVPDTEQVTIHSPSSRGLVDLTIPEGTWSGSYPDVTTSSPNVADVHITGNPAVSVHAPWGDLDRGFAHRSTRDLLFRFPSTDDLDQATAALHGGTSRKAFTDLLMKSDEYRGLDVDRTFVKYLRRNADPGGKSYWVRSIREGKALWRFRAQLFGSREYFNKAGGTNGAWVARAYADVLGRVPDSGGQAYWTRKLDRGADRGWVALQFLNAPEARRRLVDDQYLRLLERLPSSTESAKWVAALPGATGEQSLIASLVADAEYRSNG